MSVDGAAARYRSCDGARRSRTQRAARLARRPRMQQLRRPARPRGDAGCGRRRPRRRRHLPRHGRDLRERRRQRAAARRDPRGTARAGRSRDEVRLGAGGRPGLSGSHPPVDRRLSGAAANQLRRPLLPAPARSGDPDRATPWWRSTSWYRPGRCARSAARTSRRSSSRRPTGLRASKAPHVFQPSRTTTTSSAATTTTAFCRSAGSSASRTSRTSPSRAACSRASTVVVRLRRRGRASPVGTSRTRSSTVSRRSGLRGEARPYAARARHRGACLDPGHRVGHRGRDQARAGACERGGGELEARRRRPRRAACRLAARMRVRGRPVECR